MIENEIGARINAESMNLTMKNMIKEENKKKAAVKIRYKKNKKLL